MKTRVSIWVSILWHIVIPNETTGNKLSCITRQSMYLYVSLYASKYICYCPVRTAINIENQWFTKITPSFTPTNVKLGVFSLFKFSRSPLPLVQTAYQPLINRKTFCDSFSNRFVSVLYLLTQNKL